MNVEPYLNFDGRCEEALNFYREAVGAKINAIMRFSESPEPCSPDMVPPGSENKVMHSCFNIGDSVLMASDCNCKGQAKFEGISLTLNCKDDAEAERMFAALGAGGQVQMPMTETFFATKFGMVADKFGVSWMVIKQKPMK
jgi:PhnB protein